MTTRAVRSLIASLAATSLLIGGVSAAPSAVSQQTPPANAVTQGIPATGNLHIHKVLGLPQGAQSNGTEMTVDGEKGVGITFNVSRVSNADGPIDLTTQDGWKAISGIQLQENGALPNGFTKGETKNAETGTDGSANFDNLAAGLYLVEEPSNQLDANGKAVTPSAPFLVTVPMTNPDGNGWLDTVHIYPKNQVTEAPTKKINQIIDNNTGAGLHVGDSIQYQVDSTVPVISKPTEGADGKLEPGTALPDAFTITDKLPAALGQPTNIKVTFGGTELQQGDFTTTSYQVDDRWVLRVQIDPNTLNAGNAVEAKQVSVTFDAPVESIPQTLDNVAWALPDEITDPEPWDPENPGNTQPGTNPGTSTGGDKDTVPATLNFADIAVNKTDAANDQTKLAGAEFQLHRCDANGKVVGDAITLGTGDQAKDKWTTSDQGSLVIKDLAYNTKASDGTTTDIWKTFQGFENSTQFCLVETKAPAGYALSSAPVLLTFTDPVANDNQDTEVNETRYNATADIQNAKTSGILDRLPLTGGAGIWLIIALGLALAAISIALSRKKA
ncbi:SpaH/EbpB family LPXTG-anchored major pilin [Corynebacterium sp.]|uniref:SpaH/EbpB family LPXTG-anchored major pilin n=1 Tax=Corynebacterium sp. TaxID=1720 RepID=UPI0026DC0261|nr:SpaH/EbpB family LPXTG-anchored major pilin [Corynebacterium sp.]MDO5032341.1 SpaH/EbpB family LPXTG-anchored major pilin [Corynebacterium sp.]